MDFAKVTQLVLTASIMLIVLSLGLQATLQDATYLFRQPKRLLRSILAMLVIMPVLAAVLVHAFALPPAVEITIIVLAVSPVPPILHKRQLAQGGTRSYVLGLLVAAALISIVFVPAAVEFFGRIYNKPAGISIGAIARIVITSVIGPLAAGLAVRHFWPKFARRAAAPLSRFATLLLILGIVPVLFTQLPAAISLIGEGTLFALGAFVLVGLVTGALLGGPELNDRTVLAMSTASRHPGVAMAIAVANFPNERLILPSILLYLVVSAIVSGIFLGRLRQHEKANRVDSRQSPAA